MISGLSKKSPAKFYFLSLVFFIKLLCCQDFFYKSIASLGLHNKWSILLCYSLQFALAYSFTYHHNYWYNCLELFNFCSVRHHCECLKQMMARQKIFKPLFTSLISIFYADLLLICQGIFKAFDNIPHYNPSAKTRKYLVTINSPNACCKKYLKDYKDNSFHLA